jgi:hypothetical protein
MPVGLARIPDRSGPLTGEPRVRGHRRPSRNPSRGTGDSARDRALLETSLRVSGRLHRPRIRIRRPAAHRAPPLRGRAGSAYRHLPTGADAHASPEVIRSHRHRRPMETPVSQPSRRHPSDRGGLASAVVIGSAFLSLAATVVLTLAPLTRPDVRTVADQPPQGGRAGRGPRRARGVRLGTVRTLPRLVEQRGKEADLPAGLRPAA